MRVTSLGRDIVSNHHEFEYLFNRFFGHTIGITWKQKRVIFGDISTFRRERWISTLNKLEQNGPEFEEIFKCSFVREFQWSVFLGIWLTIKSAMVRVKVWLRISCVELDAMVNEPTDIYVDDLVKERRNSSALAMELRLSCTNPSTYAS